jgi:hypothetical protein
MSNLLKKKDTEFSDYYSQYLQNIKNSTSGNEEIDNFIREMQLKISNYNDIVFEWIPYDQFNEIEIVKDDCIAVYSAVWRDGPLRWSRQDEKYTRDSNKEVTLKCFHDLQNQTEFVINKV